MNNLHSSKKAISGLPVTVLIYFFFVQPYEHSNISVPPVTNEPSKTFVIFATATTTTATLPSRSTVLN